MSLTATVVADVPALSDRARELDSNGNNRIERDEAKGPLAANFDEIDCDGNEALDGAEIPGFFQGRGCGKSDASGTAGGGTEKPKAANKSAAGGGRPPQAVKLDEVRLETTQETYTVVGRITAQQTGPLSARIGGAVESVQVNVGDRVSAGEVIAQLSKARLLAERERVLAQVARHRTMVGNADRELRRLEKLKGSSAYSRSAFEKQEGEVAERKAQLGEIRAAIARLDIDIADTTLTAPYDAVVLSRHVEQGSYVNIGNPIVSLLNDKSFEVEADVPSVRVQGLDEGAEATIVVNDDVRLPARVRAIIPSDNTRTRSRPIRLAADFAGAASALANNQSVTVELPLTRGNRIVTVHKDAVLRRANGNIVFVVNDGNASMRFVRLGRGVGDKFQVLEGLEAGERVVVRGNEGLGAGGRVRVQD